MQSCLYEGWVRHSRRLPVRHSFRSRLCLVMLDLGELDQVFAGRWLWSTRRFAAGWFRRRDHFGDPQVPLDQTVRELVREQAGLVIDGPIRLLTHLRYFGFVFNPVSFYFCYARPGDTEPAAVVAEVTNTPWKQRHCYVLTAAQMGLGSERQGGARPVWLAKQFHVSPFMQLDQEYRWSLTPPGEQLGVTIASRQGGNRMFGVTMQLIRRPISSSALMRLLCAYPLQTVGVVRRIYWQALRLWWKKVPFVPHPFKGLPHGNQSGGSAVAALPAAAVALPSARRPDVTEKEEAVQLHSGPADPGK